jgi:hypothetical protein
MQFTNPIVQGEELAITAIRSDDYIESVSGWRIGRDGTAQFYGINVLGDLGVAGQVSANKFVVGPSGILVPSAGFDLVEQAEANRWDSNPDGPHPNGPVGPRGVVGYYSGAPSGTFAAAAETGIIACRFDVAPNRRYLGICTARFSQTVATDTFFFRFKWNDTNVLPTTGSASLRAFFPVVYNNIGHIDHSFTFNSLNTSPFGAGYIALLISKTAGTGTLSFTTNFENFCDIAVIDIGPAMGVGEGLASKRGGIDIYGNPGSTYTAPTPPSSPPTVHTKTYQPVWSKTFKGDNSARTDNTARCYQGYYDSVLGDQKSLVGFPYTTIQSDLSGATGISGSLNVKVNHAYYTAGVYAAVGAHNYTSAPTSWSGATVDEFLLTYGPLSAGSSYGLDLNAAILNGLKSGAYKGMAFGPIGGTSHNYYGYFAGATETGKPTLTLTYTK